LTTEVYIVGIPSSAQPFCVYQSAPVDLQQFLKQT